MLFAALTGAPPFLRDTVPATMLAHLHDPPPRASDAPGVPREFDRVIARALAKAPEDRYPSAGDFGRAAMAAAEGRSITTEERSVARGAAAPTIRRDGHLWSGDPTPPPRPEPDPEPAPIRTYKSRPRRLWAWAAGVSVIAAGALGVAFIPDSDGAPPPGGNVSEAEVTRLANSFAAAYEDEDSARLSRLLTSDAQRVSPTNRQRGRRAVVDAYRGQFAAKRTTGFELDELEAEGGAVGRATARYRASYAGEPDTVGTDDVGRDPREGPAADRDDPPAAGLAAPGSVSSVTVDSGSTSVPAGGLVAQTSIAPPSTRSSHEPPSISRAFRSRLRSVASAASLSMPTSARHLDAHVALHAHGVGRRAPARRGGGDVDHVAARDQRHLGAELAAVDLARRARRRARRRPPA